MKQRYSIILWKKAEEKSFEIIANEVFKLLNVFYKYSPCFHPVYLADDKKGSTWKIDYDELCDILKCNVNKEGDFEFADLGYNLSFYSSLDENVSTSISLCVGNQNPQFNNSVIINLPANMDKRNMKLIEEVENIFIELVGEFKPFWGCISNKANARKFKKYMVDGKPTSVHWINYWSDEICDSVGGEKFFEILNKETEVLNRGIFKIQKLPINNDDVNDLVVQDNLNNKFCLV